MAGVIEVSAACLTFADSSKSLYGCIKRYKNAPKAARRIRRVARRQYKSLTVLADNLRIWSWLQDDDPRLEIIYDAMKDGMECFDEVMRMTRRVLGGTSVRVSRSLNSTPSMWELVRTFRDKSKRMARRIEWALYSSETNEMMAGMRKSNEDIVHAQASLNAWVLSPLDFTSMSLGLTFGSDHVEHTNRKTKTYIAVGVISGAAIGGSIGYYYFGKVGGVGGALVGGFVGGFLGWLCS